MTSDSQTAALHKLANMMDLIGYPEQVHIFVHYLSSRFLTGFEQHMVECEVLRSGSVGRLPDEHCRLPEPPEEGGYEGLHQVRLQDPP